MWNPFRKSDSAPGPEPLVVQLARDPNLDQETAFTICQLIDAVGTEVTEDWDYDWLDGENPDYRALIKLPLLRQCWKLLAAKEWFSLQTTNDVDKRISTLAPIAEMTSLKTLVLQNNLIADLSPIAGLRQLVDLNCLQNRIADFSLLRQFPLLQKLTVARNPAASLRVLEALPALREFSLSIHQLSGFTECKSLPALLSLGVGNEDQETIADFSAWPEMPALKKLDAWGVCGLAGLPRFGALESLGLFGSHFADLAPLAGLKRLTHLTLCSSQPLDVSPLAQLLALRRLAIQCPKVTGLAALKSLPALREIRLTDEATADAAELAALRAELGSWDNEFRDPQRGLTPSLDLQVVDQETFDHYDSEAAYGVGPDQLSDYMLASERGWLIGKIREALAPHLEEDTDFHLPHTGGRQRTERVILYTAKACETFRELSLAIQRVLCECKNDWIIWTQACLGEGPSDEEIPEDLQDFIVWLYPTKIMVTAADAETVRNLIEWQR